MGADVRGLGHSLRKGGNTDTLVDAVLKAAGAAGHTTEKIRLGEHEIRPCVDCRICKTEPFVCPVGDGMPEIIGRLEVADVLVLGTPVYWCGPTGQMKTFFDRLRPFYSDRRLSGKRAILTIAAADGPSESDLVVEMFRRSLGFLDVELVGFVQGKAYDRGEIHLDVDAMAHAQALGATL